jgi:hypothetical protein
MQASRLHHGNASCQLGVVAPEWSGSPFAASQELPMHLILALCWTTVGLAIFWWQWQTGTPRGYITFSGQTISVGWVAFFLAFYNLLRWFFRQMMVRRPANQLPQMRRSLRQNRNREDAEERAEEPNPVFDFSDGPASGNPPPVSEERIPLPPQQPPAPGGNGSPPEPGRP